ncbi:hypothetical protein A2U01_0080975 [Trifolium medium]|uniref:Uncharacterized protein n=1 Tax=Trifolium medium TaxID=97028 RepID=A0A392THP1_9FABA|nr:hypothetical protein [Trifolium medium]
MVEANSVSLANFNIWMVREACSEDLPAICWHPPDLGWMKLNFDGAVVIS